MNDGPKRSLVAGLLMGVALAGFLDEVVFHQLLHWHHLYDRSTHGWGQFSDGVLHVVSWACMVAGLLIYSNLNRRGEWVKQRHFAGILIGLGGFQLYDGTIQHKLLGLHEIRPGVPTAPYDITWNVAAALILAAGVVLLRRARNAAP